MTTRIMTTTAMTRIMAATDIATIMGTAMDMGVIMRRSTWAERLPSVWG